MKTQKLLSIAITCLFLIGIAIPIQVQEKSGYMGEPVEEA